MSEISSDPCEDLNELKNIEYPTRFRKAEDTKKSLTCLILRILRAKRENDE